jgi:RsiW-degrading membrane proteinase PrsW (M82 family)
MRWPTDALKKSIKGIFLATLLLAAQENGKPLNEAAWIVLGAILVTVVDAYAFHISNRHDGGVRAYVRNLFGGVMQDLPRVVGTLPTVLFLLLAAMFHWRPEHRNPDGSVTAGYDTVGLYINVVLLLIVGTLAAYRSGSSVRGIILIGLFNATLGLLIVAVEIEI